jgi:hypothetical protein
MYKPATQSYKLHANMDLSVVLFPIVPRTVVRRIQVQREFTRRSASRQGRRVQLQTALNLPRCLIATNQRPL